MAEGQRPWKDRILDKIQLGDEDYKGVLYEAYEHPRPLELKKQIRRHFEKKGKAMMREKGDGVPDECNPEGCPEPGTSKEVSRSAGKSPFIFRSDLIPAGEKVYLDVEKLSLKKGPLEAKHQQVAASVAIVNDRRDLIMWSYIKWNNICQTFPQITGITKEKLEIGLDISVIQPFLEMVFEGNVVVGWDIENDMKSLGLKKHFKTEDLALQYLDESDQKRKLKDVFAHFKSTKDPKEGSFQCGVHSAIQDARATRDVHMFTMEWMKQYPDNFNYPFNIPRSQKEKWKVDPQDICRCKRKTKNKPKANNSWYFEPE